MEFQLIHNQFREVSAVRDAEDGLFVHEVSLSGLRADLPFGSRVFICRTPQAMPQISGLLHSDLARLAFHGVKTHLW
jgi:hypothetical protein